MQPREQMLKAFDGLELLTRRYDPVVAGSLGWTDGVSGAPGVDRPGDGRSLIIVHGASEHGRRYDHVARLFADRGWTVIVSDNRGHGRSGGVPMHVARFDDYLRDLDLMYRHHDLDPQHTAVLGHSFGSLISARFAQTRPTQLTALVMLAPLLRLAVEVNPLIVGWGRLVSLVAPRVRFASRVDPRDTTRDLERLAERSSDPLIHRSITCGWFFEMRSALKFVWAERSALRIPVLVVQGGADRIVDPEVARPWLDQVASSDKELRWLDDHYHELHNEPDWRETMMGVAAWLERRVRRAHDRTLASPVLMGNSGA